MIAVLSSNYEATVNWMRQEFKIISIRSRKLVDVNNVTYIIVSEPIHTYGFHFTSMIKAPNYEILEDIVNYRIIPL